MLSVTPFQTIIYEKRDGTAVVTLNRPKALNALNQQSLTELLEVFEDIRQDDAVAGVIMTGTGGKAFAAGADIKELAVLTPGRSRSLGKTRPRADGRYRDARQAGCRCCERLCFRRWM